MKNLYLLLLLLPILQVSTSRVTGSSASFAFAFPAQDQFITTLPVITNCMPYAEKSRDKISFFSFYEPAIEKDETRNVFFKGPVKQIGEPGFSGELLSSLCPI